MYLLTRVCIFTVSIYLSGGVSAQDNLSYEQKVSAIESLKNYEKQVRESGTQQVTSSQRSSSQDKSTDNLPFWSPSIRNSIDQERVIRPQKTPEIFCDKTVEHSCEMQEFLNRMQNRQEPALILNGKYRVKLAFDNDNNFPVKYFEKSKFENVADHDQAEMENRIFENYLGVDFSALNPELVNVYYSVVTIVIYVVSTEKLNRFLSDNRIQGIYHVGNSKALEEGHH